MECNYRICQNHINDGSVAYDDLIYVLIQVVPEGFGNVLRKIKKEYNNPVVYVLENGYSDYGEMRDYNRVGYHYSYLMELIKAVKRDGCRVQKYTVWSLLDNFEFKSGYTWVRCFLWSGFRVSNLYRQCILLADNPMDSSRWTLTAGTKRGNQSSRQRGWRILFGIANYRIFLVNETTNKSTITYKFETN